MLLVSLRENPKNEILGRRPSEKELEITPTNVDQSGLLEEVDYGSKVSITGVGISCGAKLTGSLGISNRRLQTPEQCRYSLSAVPRIDS